jgi:hypothetical protein
MYRPIKEMPDTSRIWVYQANRLLTNSDEAYISSNLKSFCEGWAAHGQELDTSFDINHQRFVILCVNENATTPSGCSIDSSSHIIKAIGTQLNIDFFGRSDIPFLEGNNITVHSLAQLKKLFEQGVLNAHSITINTLAPTLGEWKHKRHLKAMESWMNRFIPKISVA